MGLAIVQEAVVWWLKCGWPIKQQRRSALPDHHFLTLGTMLSALLLVVLSGIAVRPVAAGEALCEGSPVNKCLYFCHMSASGALASPGNAADPTILLEYPMATRAFSKPLALNWRVKLCYRRTTAPPAPPSQPPAAAGGDDGEEEHGGCWGPGCAVLWRVMRPRPPAAAALGLAIWRAETSAHRLHC